MDTLKTRDQQLLHRLTSILDNRMADEQFGVNELACEAGLSKSHLLRKLRSLEGKSSSRFIREYRLKKAHELLLNDAGTAAEIAYRVGFSSPTYFSSCFRDYAGYPPGEVRIRSRTAKQHVNGIPKVQASHTVTNARSLKVAILLVLLGFLALAAATYILHSYRKQALPVSRLALEPLAGRSIAVLPLVNLNSDPYFDLISQGFTDALISRLSSLSGIDRVVPYTTMATYKGSAKSIGEIVSELGVTHVLEGSIQRSGTSLTIRLRLVDGREDSYEWAEDFRAQWDQERVLTIQAMLAERLALTLTAPRGVQRQGPGHPKTRNSRGPQQQASLLTW